MRQPDVRVGCIIPCGHIYTGVAIWHYNISRRGLTALLILEVEAMREARRLGIGESTDSHVFLFPLLIAESWGSIGL